ncbi:hypothetical protein V7O66_07390 [Methanolobus sp. ZRKC3]|uniref:hypothetical protein n=1 Tax=Methanolobus sp. ZRKC3 TaxID=3125786 RepID=UPI00324E2F56
MESSSKDVLAKKGNVLAIQSKGIMKPQAFSISKAYSNLVTDKEVWAEGTEEILKQIKDREPLAHVPGYFLTVVNMAQVYDIPAVREKMEKSLGDETLIKLFDNFLDHGFEPSVKMSAIYHDLFPSMVGIFYVSDNIAEDFIGPDNLQSFTQEFNEIDASDSQDFSVTHYESEMRSGTSEIQSDKSEIKSNISGIQSDLSGTQSGMSGTQSDWWKSVDSFEDAGSLIGIIF